MYDDGGINIQYIENLLDFFDELGKTDQRFEKIFSKI